MLDHVGTPKAAGPGTSGASPPQKQENFDWPRLERQETNINPFGHSPSMDKASGSGSGNNGAGSPRFDRQESLPSTRAASQQPSPKLEGSAGAPVAPPPSVTKASDSGKNGAGSPRFNRGESFKNPFAMDDAAKLRAAEEEAAIAGESHKNHLRVNG